MGWVQKSFEEILVGKMERKQGKRRKEKKIKFQRQNNMYLQESTATDKTQAANCVL